MVFTPRTNCAARRFTLVRSACVQDDLTCEISQLDADLHAVLEQQQECNDALSAGWQMPAIRLRTYTCT
eukprot:345855-Pleurochrysis_carterae.AAC.1